MARLQPVLRFVEILGTSNFGIHHVTTMHNQLSRGVEFQYDGDFFTFAAHPFLFQILTAKACQVDPSEATQVHGGVLLKAS